VREPRKTPNTRKAECKPSEARTLLSAAPYGIPSGQDIRAPCRKASDQFSRRSDCARQNRPRHSASLRCTCRFCLPPKLLGAAVRSHAPRCLTGLAVHRKTDGGASKVYGRLAGVLEQLPPSDGKSPVGKSSRGRAAQAHTGKRPKNPRNDRKPIARTPKALTRPPTRVQIIPK